MTEWKPVPGYPAYEASDEGEVRTIPRMSQTVRANGSIVTRHLKGKLLTTYTAGGVMCIAVPAQEDAPRPQRNEPVHMMVIRAFHDANVTKEDKIVWLDGDARNNRPGNLHVLKQLVEA